MQYLNHKKYCINILMAIFRADFKKNQKIEIGQINSQPPTREQEVIRIYIDE